MGRFSYMTIDNTVMVYNADYPMASVLDRSNRDALQSSLDRACMLLWVEVRSQIGTSN